MQTFVSEDTFYASVRVLDRQRLGKQRVETLQIMKALAGLSKGWINHPATRMWRGYERALLDYQNATCNEWLRRGYKDTCFTKTVRVFAEHFKPLCLSIQNGTLSIILMLLVNITTIGPYRRGNDSKGTH